VIDPCVGVACSAETYAYHAETGALASVTDVLGGSHSFTYDNSGRLITRGAPGGVSDTYTYDADDNLIRHVVNTVNHGALTDSSSYDLRGKVRYVYSAALRGTAELNMSYTGLGAVSGFTNTGVAGGFPVEEFITDGLGNRTERKQSGGSSDPFDPDRHRRFFYDSWNRLYEMDSPSADALQFEHRESYQYDGAGNTRYSYVFERPSTASQLRHDASASYYGADNKLRVYNRHIGINEQSDDSTAGRRGTFDEYRYDALGRRVLTRTRRLGFGCDPVFVDCASVAMRTVWDGDRVLYEIRAPGGEFVTNQGDTLAVTEIESDAYTGGAQGLTYGRVAYTHAPGVTGIDEPIAITRIGSTSAGVPDPMTVYPHTGWRGMLAMGTMSNGNVSDCGYSGSGTCAPIDWPAIDATVDKGPSGSNEPQSWFGSLASAYSEGSGLSYKRNRFYDPNRGQFTQADPIGLAGGLNVYGFAEGDPVNFDDPFGLCPPRDDDLSDCAPGSSGWYAKRIATAEGSRPLNEIGGVLATCGESAVCMSVATAGGIAGGIARVGRAVWSAARGRVSVTVVREAEARAAGRIWTTSRSGARPILANQGRGPVRGRITADGTRVYRAPELKQTGPNAGKRAANLERKDRNGAKISNTHVVIQ
jgi:RHS repeat-associated protein